MLILALASVWLVFTAFALVAYFYRAWQRAPVVPNRVSYVVWLSLETGGVLMLLCWLAWLFLPAHVTSPRRERERVLQQDLFVMRSLISQYTIDKQKPLSSLDDLVTSGYLREIPIDPMTGRNDTWVVKCSNDSSESGIVDVGSGYRASSSVSCH